MKPSLRGTASLLATMCVVCGIEPATSEIVPVELGLTDPDPVPAPTISTANEGIGLGPRGFSQWRPLATLQRTRLPQSNLTARVHTPQTRGNLLKRARSSLSTRIRVSYRIRPLISVRSPLKGLRAKRALEHVEPKLRRLPHVYRVGLNLTF